MLKYIKYLPWLIGIIGVLLIGYLVKGMFNNFSETMKSLNQSLTEERNKREAEQELRIEEIKKRVEADKKIKKLRNQFDLANERAMQLEADRRAMRAEPALDETELMLLFNKYGYQPDFISDKLAFNKTDSNRLYQNIYDLQECNEYSVEVAVMRDSLYDMIYANNGYESKIESYEKSIESYEKDKESYERDMANYDASMVTLKKEVRKQKFMKNIYKIGGVAAVGFVGYAATQ